MNRVNNRSKNVLLGLAFFLLALSVYFFGQSNEEGADSFSVITPETQKKVNEHLQETGQKLLLREQQGQIHTTRALQEMEKSVPQKKAKAKNNFEINEYSEYHEFNEKVGRGTKEFSLPSNPNELIQTELFNEQMTREYTEEFKREYARQFVENARQAGWDIRVDNSFRVISVRQIRKPARQLFPGETGGGR